MRLPTLIPVVWRKAAAVLWFPVFFAIALPLTFQTAFHQPTPHNDAIAVVGSRSQLKR